MIAFLLEVIAADIFLFVIVVAFDILFNDFDFHFFRFVILNIDIVDSFFK